MEIDLATEIIDQVMVEREGFAFTVQIEYEKLPMFCSYCSIIGHTASHCKKYNAANGNKRILDSKKVSTRYVPKPPKEKGMETDNKVMNDVQQKNSSPELPIDTAIDLDPVLGPDRVIDVDLHKNIIPVIEGIDESLNSAENVVSDDESIETIFAEDEREVSADVNSGFQPMNQYPGVESNSNEFVKETPDSQINTLPPVIGAPKVIFSDMNQETPVTILHDMAIPGENWNDLVHEDLRNEGIQNQMEHEENFEPVLSKSQKKKRRQRKNYAQSELPFTRSRAGSLNLAK